jgi:hypothetical protein
VTWQKPIVASPHCKLSIQEVKMKSTACLYYNGTDQAALVSTEPESHRSGPSTALGSSLVQPENSGQGLAIECLWDPCSVRKLSESDVEKSGEREETVSQQECASALLLVTHFDYVFGSAIHGGLLHEN